MKILIFLKFYNSINYFRGETNMSNIYKVYVETPGARLIYESEIDLYSYLKKNESSIDFPGLHVYKDVVCPCDYYVKYYNDYNKSITCDKQTIEIHYPFSDLTEASIIYMGYILMESQRAKNTMLTCHAACVEKNGNAILFLGRSGSGKTTLTINLGINYGYNLVGNDRVVIGLRNDNVYVFDGTKYILMRYESIKRNLPFLLTYFENQLKSTGYNSKDSWLLKQSVFPELLNISSSDSIPKKVVKSYIIHIDESQKFLFRQSGDNPTNRLFLNEIFSMYIRGIYTTFSDKNFHAQGYIPSYDTEDYYNKRIALINKIMKDTDLEYISGKLQTVSQYIDESFENKGYNRIRKRED